MLVEGTLNINGISEENSSRSNYILFTFTRCRYFFRSFFFRPLKAVAAVMKWAALICPGTVAAEKITILLILFHACSSSSMTSCMISTMRQLDSRFGWVSCCIGNHIFMANTKNWDQGFQTSKEFIMEWHQIICIELRFFVDIIFINCMCEK